MNIYLKYYGLTFLKLWAVFFLLGAMLGSVEYVGLAWRVGLISILATGLIALINKYCPEYFTMGQKKENKK